MKTSESDDLLRSAAALDCVAHSGDPDNPHEQMREVCVGCFDRAFAAAVQRAVESKQAVKPHTWGSLTIAIHKAIDDYCQAMSDERDYQDEQVAKARATAAEYRRQCDQMRDEVQRLGAALEEVRGYLPDFIEGPIGTCENIIELALTNLKEGKR